MGFTLRHRASRTQHTADSPKFADVIPLPYGKPQWPSPQLSAGIQAVRAAGRISGELYPLPHRPTPRKKTADLKGLVAAWVGRQSSSPCRKEASIPQTREMELSLPLGPVAGDFWFPVLPEQAVP